MSSFSISTARSHNDLAAIRTLFKAYSQSLGIDLAYQEFATELSSLPGKYADTAGALLIAREAGGAAIGCVGVRPLDDDGICEMKRLYVAPAVRGSGLGRALANAIINEARRIGYSVMRLDTLPTMQSAQLLYFSLGFTRIDAYYTTPIENTVFLEKQLEEQ